MTAAMLLATPGAANASQLVDRNAKNPRIQVNSKGVALVTYRKAGKGNHVLYWGGKNWTLRMKLDRSGGWRSKKADWKNFKNTCKPYTGYPARVQYVVSACKASDGSIWMLQAWRRVKDNYGGTGGDIDLRVSHYTGAPAELWIKTDWSYGGQWQHLYGRYTYQGKGVYGNLVTPTGYVLDMKGRNIAIESWSSNYPNTAGKWARVNSFLSQKPQMGDTVGGAFCFSFAPKADAVGSPLNANGTMYSGRSTTDTYEADVPGPGVSPDIFIDFYGHGGAGWEYADPASQSGTYYTQAGADLDALANTEQNTMIEESRCHA